MKFRTLYILFGISFVIHFFTPFILTAQKDMLVINSIRLTIKENDSILIRGNIHIKKNTLNGHNIHNEGILKITDTLKCNADSIFLSSSNPYLANILPRQFVNQTYGKIVFTGVKEQVVVSKDTSIYFNKILLNNHLKLNAGIRAFDLVNLNKHNLFLNNKDLFLFDNKPNINRKEGRLTTESDSSRVYDTLNGSVNSLKLINYNDTNKNNLIDQSNIGFAISENYSFGDVSIKRFHKSIPNVTNGSIRKSFEVKSQISGIESNIRINYLKSDIIDTFQNQKNFKIYYFDKEKNRYIYIGGDTLGLTIKKEKTNLNPGIYTIADSVCRHTPKPLVIKDFYLCGNDDLNINADTKETGMLYCWTSFPKVAIKDTTSALMQVANSYMPKYGSVNFYLKITDLQGCIGYDTIRVTTKPIPTFKIETENAAGIVKKDGFCLYDSIYFFDRKNNTGSYKWSMQDSVLKTYAIPSPVHLFKKWNVNCKINLNYTDTFGCWKDTLLNISVFSVPKTEIISNSAFCLNKNISFINNSSNESNSIKKYKWLLGNGDTVIIDQAKKQSFKNLWFTSDFISTANSNPDLSYGYLSSGIYKVKLITESTTSCISSDSISITVYDSVHAVFDSSALTNVCRGIPSKFIPAAATTVTGVLQYKWILPDTIFISKNSSDTLFYTFKKSGIFPVCFIVESLSGCTDSVFTAVRIKSSPIAYFTTLPVCLHQETRIKNESTLNCQYNWKLDTDTSFIGNQMPAIRFKTAGIKNIQLSVKNDLGCTSIYSDTAMVYDLPNTNFTVNNSCLNAQDSVIVFKNVQQNTSYNWSFGDLTSDTKSQPNKKYNQPGSYKINLTAENSNGCIHTQNDSIAIYPIISADFVVSDATTNVCKGNESLLQLKLGTSSAKLKSCKWNFGNGDSLVTTESEMTYTYKKEGVFTAKLTVETMNSCVDKIQKQLTIYSLPVVDFNVDSVCLGIQSDIVLLPSTTTNEITAYQWNFGDTLNASLNTSTLMYPIHNYIKAGLYPVTVKVISAKGCVDYDTAYARVWSLPTPNMGGFVSECSSLVTLNAGNVGCNYRWNDQSSLQTLLVTKAGVYSVTVSNPLTGCVATEKVSVSLNSNVIPNLRKDTTACNELMLDAHNNLPGYRFLWSTGENKSSIKARQTGNYYVTVTSPANCIGIDSVRLIINSNPVVKIGKDTAVCLGEQLFLNGNTSNALSYQWSDGSIQSVLSVPTSTVTTTIYSLTVTDNNGCSGSDNIKINVNSLPIVELGNDIVVCADQKVMLDAGASNASYLWSTNEKSKTIQATQSGRYSVTISNTTGCNMIDSISVVIHSLPQVDIGKDIVSCMGSTILLSPLSTNYAGYSWSTAETTASIYANTAKTGIKNYQLQVKDLNNCLALSNMISVTVKSLPVAILPKTSDACNLISIDAGNDGATFKWSNGITTQKQTVYQSGLYKVTITNGEQCSINDSIQVTIKYITMPNLGHDASVCGNEVLQLQTGIHDTSYTFNWSNLSNAESIWVSSEGQYRVTVSNGTGCTASDTIDIKVNDYPTVNLGTDFLLCTNEHVLLDASKSGSFYFWHSNNGLYSTNRVVEIHDTGNYWVDVYSAEGCKSSDTIMITPTNSSISALFIVASNLHSGDSVKFVDMSYPNPTTWYWDFGDMQTSTQQDPVHRYFGCDTFRVVEHVSNGICNATLLKPIFVEGCLKSLKPGEENSDWKSGDEFIQIINSKVFPNPTKGLFAVKAELSTEANIDVYIFNLMGKMLSRERILEVKEIEQYYNISKFPSGIYIVKIIAGTDYKVWKVVKE